MLFYRSRRFTREEFKELMYSLSKPDAEALAFAKSLADSKKYFMGTIPNESRGTQPVPDREVRGCDRFSKDSH